MKLNIGDYVRTEKGKIDKYSPIWVEHNKFEDNYYYVYPDKEDYYDHRELIIKSSPNIIDLIQVGDYVNGVEVVGFDGGYIVINETNPLTELWKTLERKDIKSIVTKEQFESMKYKIGDKENE